jgi:hypothetical protein
MAITQSECVRLARALVDLQFNSKDEADRAIVALLGDLSAGEGRQVLRVAIKLFPADFARLFARTCNVQQLARGSEDDVQ